MFEAILTLLALLILALLIGTGAYVWARRIEDRIRRRLRK